MDTQTNFKEILVPMTYMLRRNPEENLATLAYMNTDGTVMVIHDTIPHILIIRNNLVTRGFMHLSVENMYPNLFKEDDE